MGGTTVLIYPPVYLLSTETVGLLPSLPTSRPGFYFHVKIAVLWPCYPYFTQPSILKIPERAHKQFVLKSLCPSFKLL